MKYAEGVVDKIMKGNLKFWADAIIGVMKWAASWLPEPWLVCMTRARHFPPHG